MPDMCTSFGSWPIKCRASALMKSSRRSRFTTRAFTENRKPIRAGRQRRRPRPELDRPEFAAIGFINVTRGVSAVSWRASQHGMEGIVDFEGDSLLHQYFQRVCRLMTSGSLGCAVRYVLRVPYCGHSPVSRIQPPIGRCRTGGNRSTRSLTTLSAWAATPIGRRTPAPLRSGEYRAGSLHHRGLAQSAAARREGPREAFTNQAFAALSEDLRPDCMGAVAHLLAPKHAGPGQPPKDDSGKPMKNWWPFLFY